MTAQKTEFIPRMVDEPADVRFGSNNTPLAMRWHGSIWQAVGEPVLVAAQTWRFKAQTGPVSPTLEFDIVADPLCAGWRLRRITEG